MLLCLKRFAPQGFDEERARPAIDEALKPRTTRKGKALPVITDLEELVGRSALDADFVI